MKRTWLGSGKNGEWLNRDGKKEERYKVSTSFRDKGDLKDVTGKESESGRSMNR